MKIQAGKTSKMLLAGIVAAGILQGGTQVHIHAASANSPVNEAGANTAPILIPLRAAAEAIGAVVRYDAASRQVLVRWAGHEMALSAGHSDIKVDERTITLEKPLAVNAQGRLLVPLSAFNEALGIDSVWNEKEGIQVGASSYEARSGQLIHQFANQAWSEAGEAFSPQLAAALPQPMLEAYWNQIQAVYGRTIELSQASVQRNTVHTTVKLQYTTDKQVPFTIEVRFNEQGQLNDLFVPAMPEVPYSPPSYDHPLNYTEEQVVIGEGQFALPGKLTIPADGKIAAVAVLVHGSGPNDEDETVGAVKMFRDLAVGLANNGIATLRYTKRTREHTFQSVTTGFTVNEEVIDDALLAGEKVNRDPRFANVPVILVGHSQGGMLVPRMLNQDTNKSFDAAVIMAGPSVPLEDIMLMQYKNALERAKQQGAPAEILAQLEQQVTSWEQMVAVIKDERYTASSYPADLPLANASWWFDFRNNYGGEIAKTQHIPLFIVQGDNDMQVDASNLDGWKRALSSRSDVAYRLYPKLNHLFVPYDQPSTGAEYMIPGNVPLELSADLAEWMKQQAAH